MVNGPASGGEFPLGKEYWENQAKQEGFVPKKTIKVPVGETQQGKVKYELKNRFSKKENAKLIKQYEKRLVQKGEYIKQTKPMTGEIEILKPDYEPSILEKIMQSIPPEDMAKLTTKKAIIDYIKAHPELKQSIELLDNKEETKPVVAKKIQQGELPSEYEAMPEIKQAPVMLGSENDVPDEEKIM